MRRNSPCSVCAGVNVSLDTLDPDKFTMITRGGLLARVLEGIATAQAAGLAVKLDEVALKGLTEDGIDNLIDFAHAGGMTLTLIETMPLGEIGADRIDQFLPLSLAASPDRAALDVGRFGGTNRRAGALRPRDRNRRQGRFHPRP